MRTALTFLAAITSGMLQTACAQIAPIEYAPVISRTPITQAVSVPREVCVNEPAGAYYRNNFRSSESGDEDLSRSIRAEMLSASFKGLGEQAREQERREAERRAQPAPPAPPKQPETRPPRDEPRRDHDRGRDRGYDHGRGYNPPRTVYVPVPTPSYVQPRYIAPAPIYVAPQPYYSAPPPVYYAPQPSYVRRCYTQNEYVTQTVGFDIVYEYLGQKYRAQVTTDPGSYVALRQGYFPGDTNLSVYPDGATQKPTLTF